MTSGTEKLEKILSRNDLMVAFVVISLTGMSQTKFENASTHTNNAV
jgi:hypothetical protein